MCQGQQGHLSRRQTLRQVPVVRKPLCDFSLPRALADVEHKNDPWVHFKEAMTVPDTLKPQRV